MFEVCVCVCVLIDIQREECTLKDKITWNRVGTTAIIIESQFVVVGRLRVGATQVPVF